MIVERIRRRRRRLRASKGESTHIASRDDASQKANTSPRRSGAPRRRARANPGFTRARAVDKWSHMFSLFFPYFFGCWVLGVQERRDARVVYAYVCVCACTYNEDTVESLLVSHSIATCAFWAFVVAPPKTLLHLALPSFEALPPKNGKTVVRAPTSDVRVVSKASRRRTKQSGRTVENVYVHISY